MLKKLLKTLPVVALVLSTNTIANNYDDYGVDFIKIDMSALDTSTTAMTLSEIKKLHDTEQNERLTVERIDFYFNQFPYKDDMISRNKEDYWKSPSEFYADNGGDCEDYVVMKYLHLLELGISENKLHLSYVKVIGTDSLHMVLEYKEFSDSTPLLLDNMMFEVKPKNLRKDLITLATFNESSEWINPLLLNAQSKIRKNVARYKIALKKSSKEEIVF